MADNKSMSPVIRHCPACNTELMCHDDTDAGACWCRNYPALMPVDADADCLCEACLVKAIRQRIQDMMDVNDTGRMVEIAGRYRHSATLTESIDYTIEQGNFVFSQWYHLKRGHCCGNSCRHCPYKS